MKRKSLPLTLLLYFFRLFPLRFCNFRGGASRREVLLSLPLLVLWYGILYVVALCFQDSLPGFIPPASIPYILLLLIQIPLAALIFRWWNVLKTIDRVDSNFIPVAANVALAATTLSAWIGYMDYALYAACACAVMFIPIALKLRRDMSDAVSTCLGSVTEYSKTKILLEGGADPNASTARNSDGLTPLQEQVWRVVKDYYGADESCKLLLSYGADPNAKNEDGDTPLHHAACFGGKWLCWLLLTYGADPNAKNEDGVTPLHEAAGRERVAVCQLLLTHGADPNARTTARFLLSAGSTPLHLVAGKLNKALRDSDEDDEKVWRSVYNMLLSAGADPNLANEDGLTPDMIVKGRSAPQKSSQK